LRKREERTSVALSVQEWSAAQLLAFHRQNRQRGSQHPARDEVVEQRKGAAEAAAFARLRPTPRVPLAGALALALAGVAPRPVVPAPRRAAAIERPAAPTAAQCVPDRT
jgi:hypothetical protein